MKAVGFLLILAGILVLVFGGIRYKREKTVLDFGTLRATVTEQRTVPLSPIAGGIALGVGFLLIVTPRRRLA